MNPLNRVSPEFIFPQPDKEGIEATQRLYKEKVGKELTEGEAREVLSRVMRYLFLLNFPHEVRGVGENCENRRLGSEQEHDTIKPPINQHSPQQTSCHTSSEDTRWRTRGQVTTGLLYSPG